MLDCNLQLLYDKLKLYSIRPLIGSKFAVRCQVKRMCDGQKFNGGRLPVVGAVLLHVFLIFQSPLRMEMQWTEHDRLAGNTPTLSGMGCRLSSSYFAYPRDVEAQQTPLLHNRNRPWNTVEGNITLNCQGTHHLQQKPAPCSMHPHLREVVYIHLQRRTCHICKTLFPFSATISENKKDQ